MRPTIKSGPDHDVSPFAARDEAPSHTNPDARIRHFVGCSLSTISQSVSAVTERA